MLGVLLAVLFGIGWWAGHGAATADLYSGLDLFVEVLHKVEDNYVDPVQPKKLIEGGLRGMLRDLDPYSQYLDPKAFNGLESFITGEYGGVGLVVGIRDHWPTVISPIEGGPAWNAGVRSGDVLVKVEGRSTQDLSIDDMRDLLRGDDGTPVQLTVVRAGDGEERELTIERRRLVNPSVPYAFLAAPRIGYVRLATFSEKSGAELLAALDTLRAQGAHALVLDLRGNPGGVLEQAVAVAQPFVPEGKLLVSKRGRAPGMDQKFFSGRSQAERDWPMVVLIDGGSASAAEIAAGALQDLDRALVIGQTSFGKGSVQSVYPLRVRQGGLKLTTALYYTPSGRSIHRVRPDTAAAGAEEGDLDVTTPPATAPDSVPRPMFRTASGRRVYGGGGITPDLDVAPDSLPPLTQRIEEKGLLLRFAGRWVGQHPETRAGEPLPAAAWDAFVSTLRDEKVEFAPATLATERPRLERALARELARRIAGNAAAARIALADDPVMTRAIAVLTQAKSPRDVFAPVAALSPKPTPDRHASH